MLVVFTITWCIWVVPQTVIRHLTAEPNHSTIGFSIGIGGGLTRVTGKFTEYDLQLKLVDEDLARSQVDFSIAAASVDTGLDARDEHLRDTDFFNVAKYPSIIFKSTAIIATGRNFEMKGILTIRGIEKEVTIPVEMFTADKTVGIQIRTRINRNDFGVGASFQHTSMIDFLSDGVDIEINLWTKRDKRF